MNIKLLRSFIRESLGREIMFSPEKLSIKDVEGSQQREATVVDTVDKIKLSVEEEANILKIFTFDLWSNDEDTYIGVDDDDLVSPDEFDMSKHGIDYLSSNSPYRPCKHLRKVFARSYNHFKNLSE